MLESLRLIAQLASILFLGIALGGAWFVAIVTPNVAYDRQDGRRADADVRAMLKAGSPQIGFILLATCACGVLAGNYASAATSVVAAFGFFTNRWTLASFKPGEGPKDGEEAPKTQRVLAVAFTLIFSGVIVIAAVLALLGI